jgi:hypothetical protein
MVKAHEYDESASLMNKVTRIRKEWQQLVDTFY